jgi:hypothetical protein
MTTTQPTASLVLSGNTLRIRGDGPIAASFNKDMVRRLFALPSVTNFWSPTDVRPLLAGNLLSRLTKQAYDSMLKVIASDNELKVAYEAKCKSFAAYAHPSTGVWPDDYDGLMVLETIPVDLPFLMAITWFIDGSIKLSALQDVRGITLTEEEFLEGYGKTFREYCETRLPMAIEKCQRALSLIAVENPTKATVTFINRKSDVEKKAIVFWQSDQIEQYLGRHELSHIASDEVKDEDKSPGLKAVRLAANSVEAPVQPRIGEKPCPMCAEMVKAAAKKCRHCGHLFE